ncbi:hypothetical protein MITS9504_00025 [Synechococcus sp. MIT S9504]|nr:hypothetical protein MITS9504_00025 [Synechococcus sp. MIT S9504]
MTFAAASIGAGFRAEGFAVAHHSFRRWNDALTALVFTPDQISIHGRLRDR